MTLLSGISQSNALLERISDVIRKHPLWVLHLLIVFGLLLRIFRLWQEDFQPRDSLFYLENAKIVLDQGWKAFYQTGIEAYKNMPPGFFLLLQAGSAVGLSVWMTGALLLAGSYLLLTYSIYWGMNVLWQERKYALLGVLFAATTPWLLRLGCSFLRDAPYFSCGAAALACGAAAVTREKFRYWIAFPFLVFCMVMLRKEGFEMLAAFFVWSGVSFLIQLIRRRWRSAGFALLSGLLVTLLTLLPLLILEHYFRAHFDSRWEVIPVTWSGYIWSMFKTLLKS